MKAIFLLCIILCLHACASKPVIDDSKEDKAIKQFIEAKELSTGDDIYLTFSAYLFDETLAWWYLSNKFGIVWNPRIPISTSPKQLLEISEGCKSLKEAENIVLFHRSLLRTPSKAKISPENNLKQRCSVRRAYRINNPHLRNLIRLGHKDINDTS